MQEPRQLSKTEILLSLKREHLRPVKISIFQVPEIINEAFYYKIKLVFVSTELSKTFTMISRTTCIKTTQILYRNGVYIDGTKKSSIRKI